MTAMHRRPVLGLALAAALAPARLLARTATPAPIDGQGYRIVKDWNFGENIRDVDALRAEFHTRYVYDNGRLDHLNDEWQRYRDNGNHVFEDGALSLVARRTGDLKPGGIESGMLRSRWTGQYGYYEARMKVPRGRGLWPAFWLNPQDQVWPPEIDIMEIVDNGRDTTRNSFHNVHLKGPRKPTRNSTRLDKAGSYHPGFDFADDFHVFSVDWSADRVRHYVDDVLVVDRGYVWEHQNGKDAGPAHVLINLAVGGGWPGAPQRDTPFPARLQVDYIRVWQK